VDEGDVTTVVATYVHDIYEQEQAKRRVLGCRNGGKHTEARLVVTGSTIVAVGEVRKQEQALLIRAASVVVPRLVHWLCNHDGREVCCLFLTGAFAPALIAVAQEVPL